MNETFEGIWPSTGWTVDDLSEDGYERKWDDDNYKYHGGYWGVWPSRGGANGIDPDPLHDHYFNNMNTRMIYGPFDLRDAVKADVSFWLWREFETCCDYLALEVSTDNVHFQEITRWTSNNLNWANFIHSLDGYIGHNSVWVAWRFYSDNSIVYDGPWVDDIQLRKYVPGQVTPYGTFSYYDRNNFLVDSRFMKVYLYDDDPGGINDLMAITTTDASGYFQFPALANWDVDDNDPNPDNRKLDLYIIWETFYYDSGTSHHSTVRFNGDTYKYQSMTWVNAPDGFLSCSSYLPPDFPNLEAMWIFQDLRNAWEYVYNNTNGPKVDPGSVIAKWQDGEDCYNGTPFLCNSFFYAGTGEPFIFVKFSHRFSADAVVHETGHNYMFNSIS